MKKSLLAAACLLATLCTYAENTCKAVVSFDKKRITFYYDEIDHSLEGYEYPISEKASLPEWYADYKTIRLARFDYSFRDARPNSTAYWFAYIDLKDPDAMSALKEIDGIEFLNTSEVTNMSNMFYNCDSLKSIDLSNFNTGKVTYMPSMFYNCASLKSIDLSNFSTQSATSLAFMFEGCTGLKELDLSGFRTEKVTSTERMFSKCKNLETITASQAFDISEIKNSANMFAECENLVGGNGTTYDESIVDKTYAKFDNGSGDPGYFTKQEITITIPGSGFITLYCPEALDFPDNDNYTALTVSSFDIENQLLKIRKIKNAPANTPILIFGNKGTYSLKKCENASDIESILTGVYGNLMVPDYEGGYANYVLYEGKFYKAEEFGTLVKNGTAYLSLPIIRTTKKLYLEFEYEEEEENEETSDISKINGDGNDDNAIYNLAGQKVDGNYKGIVIKNGKIKIAKY